MDLAERIGIVEERVAAAARRSGRPREAITIVAVCKTVDRPAVDRAYALGLRDFGENRVQIARDKFGPDRPGDLTLHLIGSLQTNKVREAVRLVNMVHSVDRPSLIAELGRRTGQAGARLPILFEVNVAGEATKQGAAPEAVPELLAEARRHPTLLPRGLMTMAPFVADAEDTRPVFRALRELSTRLRRANPDLQLDHLSMGMTNDFEVAIEEGATIVRIGRAIFT